MNQPPVCNKFVAPGCIPFPECGYPVDNLSGVNKEELVNIFRVLCQQNKELPRAHLKRKIKAMEKVLRHFGLYHDNPIDDREV